MWVPQVPILGPGKPRTSTGYSLPHNGNSNNQHDRRVPHPFAFFANGWETTNLNRIILTLPWKLKQ